jgi:hypothetical protein
MQFDIKNRVTGAVQFTAKIECTDDAPLPLKIGLAAKWAASHGAYLSGANLIGAYLIGASLSGADLVDGGQRRDGYRFVGYVRDNALRIVAGCRDFTMQEAREHWARKRGGTPLGDETMCLLDHIERVAIIRGLIPAQSEQTA